MTFLRYTFDNCVTFGLCSRCDADIAQDIIVHRSFVCSNVCHSTCSDYQHVLFHVIHPPYDKLYVKSSYPKLRTSSTLPLILRTAIEGIGSPLNQFFLTIVYPAASAIRTSSPTFSFDSNS